MKHRMMKQKKLELNNGTQNMEEGQDDKAWRCGTQVSWIVQLSIDLFSLFTLFVNEEWASKACNGGEKQRRIQALCIRCLACHSWLRLLLTARSPSAFVFATPIWRLHPLAHVLACSLFPLYPQTGTSAEEALALINRFSSVPIFLAFSGDVLCFLSVCAVICGVSVAPIQFGSATVRAWGGSRCSDFRLGRFLGKGSLHFSTVPRGTFGFGSSPSSSRNQRVIRDI